MTVWRATLKEFKEFAIRGSAVEMAVGIMLGTAFGNLVHSLVTDVVMPPLGQFLGRVDFSQLYVNLSTTRYASLAEAEQAGAPTINYGVFLNETTHFLITAIVVFLFVKQLNRLKR